LSDRLSRPRRHASVLVDIADASGHLPEARIEQQYHEGEHTMRCVKVALAVALAVGSLSSIASTANAGMVAGDVSTAVDRLTLVEQVQFVFGGHKHCWYPDGWHGPGWYWCGYRLRKGLGWGGPEGYQGWKHR
jgi:hypothetical protein